MLLHGSCKKKRCTGNEHILTTDNIYKSPGKARPYLNRGLFYFNKNRIDDAIREFEKAVKIYPNLSEAKENLNKVVLFSKKKPLS